MSIGQIIAAGIGFAFLSPLIAVWISKAIRGSYSSNELREEGRQ